MCILISLGWLRASWVLTLKKHSVIYIKASKREPGFFKRKKDDLIMVLISTLIGIAIGYFIP
jgi:hypothetical protein